MKFLDMKHELPATSRAHQKTVEAPRGAQGLLLQPLGHRAQRHGLDRCPGCPLLPRLFLHGLVFELQAQCRQACRGASGFGQLGDAGGERQPVGRLLERRAQLAVSACWALRASSRSTVFIIDDGPVSALAFCTVRWRSTASLNLKACSSSAITA